MNCIGCKGELNDNNSLKCNTCQSYYCLVCLNFGGCKNTNDLDPKQLSALKCPSCTNLTRRRRGKEPPVTPVVQSPSKEKLSPIIPGHLTINSISELLDQKLAPTSSTMIDSRNILLQEVKGLINSEVNKIINELKDEFTRTTDFIMDEVKSLNKLVAEKDSVINTLQTEQLQLKNEVKLCRDRLSVIEKLSRDKNVELQCVPENHNENVVSLFKALCETVSFPVSEVDIHACRRVAKMDATSKRPRNIVVTLTSSRLRDSLISAVHRFNKANRNQRLNTCHIGLKGESQQIFVSEHLTPETKQLYSAARRTAKEKGYTYCWVKFGKIYLRKSDDNDALLIKNLNFLNSLK